MTLSDLTLTLDSIVGTLQDRGYTRCKADFRLENSTETNRFRLNASCWDPAKAYYTIYVEGFGESWEECEENFRRALEEETPPLSERRRKQLNVKLSEAAELADKLGEDLPEFNTFAEVLRQHMRSNLLEVK